MPLFPNVIQGLSGETLVGTTAAFNYIWYEDAGVLDPDPGEIGQYNSGSAIAVSTIDADGNDLTSFWTSLPNSNFNLIISGTAGTLIFRIEDLQNSPPPNRIIFTTTLLTPIPAFSASDAISIAIDIKGHTGNTGATGMPVGLRYKWGTTYPANSGRIAKSGSDIQIHNIDGYGNDFEAAYNSGTILPPNNSYINIVKLNDTSKQIITRINSWSLDTDRSTFTISGGVDTLSGNVSDGDDLLLTISLKNNTGGTGATGATGPQLGPTGFRYTYKETSGVSTNQIHVESGAVEVHDTDLNSISLSAFYETVPIGSLIIVYNNTKGNVKVTTGTYSSSSFACTDISSWGSAFSEDENVYIFFSFKGSTGSTGETGPSSTEDYTPDQESYWTDTDPADFTEAIDRMAAVLSNNGADPIP